MSLGELIAHINVDVARREILVGEFMAEISRGEGLTVTYSCFGVRHVMWVCFREAKSLGVEKIIYEGFIPRIFINQNPLPRDTLSWGAMRISYLASCPVRVLLIRVLF